jgi:hypothetical protein
MHLRECQSSGQERAKARGSGQCTKRTAEFSPKREIPQASFPLKNCGQRIRNQVALVQDRGPSDWGASGSWVPSSYYLANVSVLTEPDL